MGGQTPLLLQKKNKKLKKIVNIMEEKKDRYLITFMALIASISCEMVYVVPGSSSQNIAIVQEQLQGPLEKFWICPWVMT